MIMSYEAIKTECALCKKVFPIEELRMLPTMEASVALMAQQSLLKDPVDPLPELSCCKKRGLSSSSLFCPVCREKLNQETIQDNE